MPMNHIYTLIAISFVISALIAFFGIPLIVHLCRKFKVYDQPNERKIHKHAIPRLGGLVFLPAMGVGTVISLAYGCWAGYECYDYHLTALVMVVGAIIIYLLGFFDDLKNLNARTKFVFLVIASSLVPFCNLMLNNLYGLFGVYEMPLPVSVPLTIFIILLVVNSLNLLDGIDGLASGVGIIILSYFLYLFIHLESVVFAVVCAALIAALLVFFCYNVFGKEGKNKIFMGDAGSLILGYVLAYLAIKFQMINEHVFVYRDDALLVSYSMFVVPVFDLVRVAFSRLLDHKPMFEADKRHIHHLLLNTGCTMHQALFIILALVVFFIWFNFQLNNCEVSFTIIFFVDIAIYSLLHLVLYLISKNRSMG